MGAGVPGWSPGEPVGTKTAGQGLQGGEVGWERQKHLCIYLERRCQLILLNCIPKREMTCSSEDQTWGEARMQVLEGKT